MVEVSGLTYHYGLTDALRGVDLTIPEGALFALLGPNGAGKTTLLQILVGLRRASGGRARVMGIDASAISSRDRVSIAYVNEGQRLPDWMHLSQLEAYVAPMYPTWDAALATTLRSRFELPGDRAIRTFSRGERMKAALLCSLAPRPRLLVMDEPFSGMDAIVKDELVRGLLESAGSEGWTVLLSSHDIGELEMLADRVGILVDGRMRVATTMDDVRARFRRVEVWSPTASTIDDLADDWMSVDRAANRLAFTVDAPDERRLARDLESRFPSARIDVRPATLREVFVAVAGRRSDRQRMETAA